MQATIDISPALIADIMVTAIEGNHMTASWCAGVSLHAVSAETKKALAEPWYSDAKLYEGVFTIKVKEFQDGGKVKEHLIDRKGFERALTLMASKAGKHLGAILSEDYDSITADVFLQYAALGDIVYG